MGQTNKYDVTIYYYLFVIGTARDGGGDGTLAIPKFQFEFHHKRKPYECALRRQGVFAVVFLLFILLLLLNTFDGGGGGIYQQNTRKIVCKCGSGGDGGIYITIFNQQHMMAKKNLKIG